jgi:hypothetical protein
MRHMDGDSRAEHMNDKAHHHSEVRVMATIPDDEIKRRWEKASWLHHRKSLLAKRLAKMEVEELEAVGVTEEDIDRLYPLTTIQLWLRDHFVDPSDIK